MEKNMGTTMMGCMRFRVWGLEEIGQKVETTKMGVGFRRAGKKQWQLIHWLM